MITAHPPTDSKWQMGQTHCHIGAQVAPGAGDEMKPVLAGSQGPASHGHLLHQLLWRVGPCRSAVFANIRLLQAAMSAVNITYSALGVNAHALQSTHACSSFVGMYRRRGHQTSLALCNISTGVIYGRACLTLRCEATWLPQHSWALQQTT